MDNKTLSVLYNFGVNGIQRRDEPYDTQMTAAEFYAQWDDLKTIVKAIYCCGTRAGRENFFDEQEPSRYIIFGEDGLAHVFDGDEPVYLKWIDVEALKHQTNQLYRKVMKLKRHAQKGQGE